jgi:hypothetical protein
MTHRVEIHAKAIIIGLATGFALGFFIGPLETVFFFGQSLAGTPLHIASLVFGSLATLFGAYLTARNAPTDKLANVMLFWAINEFLGILSLFIVTLPLWYNILGTISVFMASLLGWYLERITHDRL